VQQAGGHLADRGAVERGGQLDRQRRRQGDLAARGPAELADHVLDRPVIPVEDEAEMIAGAKLREHASPP
jgi:hypothetical protein